MNSDDSIELESVCSSDFIDFDNDELSDSIGLDDGAISDSIGLDDDVCSDSNNLENIDSSYLEEPIDENSVSVQDNDNQFADNSNIIDSKESGKLGGIAVPAYTSIRIDDLTVYSNEKISLQVRTSMPNGRITIDIDGKRYQQPNRNSNSEYAYVNITSPAEKGKYNCFATFTPNQNYYQPTTTYMPSNCTFRLTVLEKKTFDGIQGRIDAAKENSTISLNGTYTGNGSVININKSLTIKGIGKGAKLDAYSNSQIFNISADNVVLDNLFLLNGDANNRLIAEEGGAIYSSGNYLKINNCSFSYNSAQYGGAIYSTGDYVNITKSNFILNTAFYTGGAIELDGNNNYVNNSTFQYNCGYHAGGSIAWVGSNGLLENSNFIARFANENQKSQFGGAIVWIGSNGNVTRCTFFNNSARNSGAAVYWRGENGSLTYSIFDNNSADDDLAYHGNPNFVSYNFWGFNINSTEDFTDYCLIYYDKSVEGSQGRDGYFAPDNWINIIFENDYIDFAPDNGTILSFNFKLNNNESLSELLPNYNMNLSVYETLSSKNLPVSQYYGFKNNSYSVLIGSSPGIYKLTLTSNFALNETFDLYIKVLSVLRTGNDTQDLQNAIDNAPSGAILFLNDSSDEISNYLIDTIYINKSISLRGKGLTSISLLNSSNVFFNVSAKENNSNLVNLAISGIDFYVKNKDVLVFSKALNNTNALKIDLPFIDINDNTIDSSDENIVAESITILRVESDRAILAPTSNITVRNNNILAGVKPFEFIVNSIYNGNDVSIPNDNFVKKATEIIYQDMNTTTVVTAVEGRNGKYFEIHLIDSDNQLLANKPVQFGFNGKIYDKITDDFGKASLQINLARADIYTFAVSFLGDELYNSSFAVAKITVKKQNPKLTADTKTYKYNNNNKVLSTKLTDAYGNAIKGKTVKFTVNGKTYSAKTNDKGIASVKVSLSTKKTYKYTVKFAGDNSYNAVSKTGKLIINSNGKSTASSTANTQSSSSVSNQNASGQDIDIRYIASSIVQSGSIGKIYWDGDMYICQVLDENGTVVCCIAIDRNGNNLGVT